MCALYTAPGGDVYSLITPPVAVSPDVEITSPEASVPVLEKKSKNLACGLLNERRAILYFLNIYAK
jgi:hypothetical protein